MIKTSKMSELKFILWTTRSKNNLECRLCSIGKKCKHIIYMYKLKNPVICMYENYSPHYTALSLLSFQDTYKTMYLWKWEVLCLFRGPLSKEMRIYKGRAPDFCPKAMLYIF